MYKDLIQETIRFKLGLAKSLIAAFPDDIQKHVSDFGNIVLDVLKEESTALQQDKAPHSNNPLPTINSIEID